MALLKAPCFQKLSHFLSILIPEHFKNPKRNIQENNYYDNHQFRFNKFQFLEQKQDLKENVIIFNVETALLRCSSLFPYFMLVAFEAASPIRAFILFVLYPFIILCSKEFALKVMVLICFSGLRKERFREGKTVLPKFLLEDVGLESFEVLRRGKKTVALSNLPQVMVESFLKDYLDIDFVVGKDLKAFCGYFVGVMEEKGEFDQDDKAFQDVLEITSNAIGISGFNKSLGYHWFSYCKEIYLVNEQERRNWHQLPRNSYPKPLIFHDGRLAFKPTFLATLAMFMWLPIGIPLGLIRLIVASTLPLQIAIPIIQFTGVKIRIFNPKNNEIGKSKRNNLYVCNHKTLLDPIAVSYGTRRPLTAVTYSLSRMSELISPIKTVRLTRNRDQDAELMHKLLSQGDVIVCPEGTTCREPYLLRFSPLFTEITNEIFPVAMNCQVTMFYGTTVSGLKLLDPLFFPMNPRPCYSLRFLDMVRRENEKGSGDDDDENLRFKVANLVQNEIAKALGFTCTKLTRKDKYLTLAGNEGIVRDGN